MSASCSLLYALVDGVKRLPEKGLWGTCPQCGDTTISHCGSVNVHHWQHKSLKDCDSWAEARGPWHTAWQKCVSPDDAEVVVSSHRADIVGRGGCVIELQHSSIQVEEIAEREEFYGNMVWLFDATERFEFVTTGWRAFFSLRRLKHIHACKKPVYLDFGNSVVEVEEFSDAVAKMSGFGRVLSRESFAERYLNLTGSPPPSLDTPGTRWLGNERYASTTFPTRWIGPQGSTIELPTGTPYLPLMWEFKKPGERGIPEWERILQDSRLGNGWTRQSLLSMTRFLRADKVIIDGLLRLIPAAATSLSVEATVSATELLLREVDSHIAAGRLPMMPDEDRQQLLESAASFERRHNVRSQPKEDNLTLFD